MKKPLFCAFNRRFDPGMSAVYRQVKEGKIGKVYQIKTCSRDSPLPPISFLKISNGMYHDCAVHDIDMICWIVGEVPVGVMALGSTFNNGIKALNDVDTIAIILKFPSGILGSIDLSRHSSYGYDQRLEVRKKLEVIPISCVSSCNCSECLVLACNHRMFYNGSRTWRSPLDQLEYLHIIIWTASSPGSFSVFQ